MKESIIKKKSFEFALRIIKLYKYLVEFKKEFVMSKQLLRSGTAIGALVREAEHAESRADFIHKMSMALKESNESEYWLELLHKSDFIDQSEYDSLNLDSKEILKILISIVKTTKNS